MLSLVIQAGGQSKRMGQDKGLVSFLGKPLIQRVIDRLAPLADEILITTNHMNGYQSLGCRLATDLYPERGSLGGLFTALHEASCPLVAVVACDMPFANPQILVAAQNCLLDEVYDAAVPLSTVGMEPFHAVYRRQTCLPVIQSALDADRWRADSWLSLINTRFIPMNEILQYDPAGLALWNVNTPEELSQAEERAKSI